MRGPTGTPLAVRSSRRNTTRRSTTSGTTLLFAPSMLRYRRDATRRRGPRRDLAALAALVLVAVSAPCSAAPQHAKLDDAAAAKTTTASFDGHKVLRAVPTTEAQVKRMQHFLEKHPSVDPWQEPTAPGRPVDLLVSPADAKTVDELLKEVGLQAREMIPDVGSVVSEEQRHILDSKRANAEFGWDNYNTLDEINKWLNDTARKYPSEVSVIQAGPSFEKRTVLGLKIKFQEGAPIAFIEAGIHAREWVSPATATFLINEILTSEDPELKEILRSYEWHIFPSSNPDGYVYTHTKDRLWRKTRSRNGLTGCYGADPNRNWPFHWGEVGTSYIPCFSTYAGSKAESEPETRSLRGYLDAVNEKRRVRVYVSVHSYSQLILFPWGYTDALAEDHDALNAAAADAAKAAAKRYGTQFTYGSISRTIYPASGNTVDYAYSKGVKFPFAYELRDTGKWGFLLPKEQIRPAAEETVDSIAAILRAARQTKTCSQ